jgi:hypothetical protein
MPAEGAPACCLGLALLSVLLPQPALLRLILWLWLLKAQGLRATSGGPACLWPVKGYQRTGCICCCRQQR